MGLHISIITPLSLYVGDQGEQRKFWPDFFNGSHFFLSYCSNTVELQWPEHLWNLENMFETGVVRANEC